LFRDFLLINIFSSLESNNTQQSNLSTVEEKRDASKSENTTSAKIRVILSNKLLETNSDHDPCAGRAGPKN
jgi:hypothetical protein